MKFLCDQCQTRYSIGDDRVRGKILKIRCKHCGNVITVREGMPEDAPASAGSGRAKRPTTMAPPISGSAPASGGGQNALGAAFATALTASPPAALEEEWYVSMDGEQEGPFSLPDARRWVASKPLDADLHCWSEGFDDWLPVDKVRHFRGLRVKPTAAATPPPLPPGVGGRVGAAAARPAPVEDQPQPLFAATMASLEKSAAPLSPGRELPRPIAGAGLPSATPPDGARAMPFAPTSGETQVDGPAFDDALAAAATPPPGPGDGPDQPEDDDDELSIGEVSRVVKLADLRPSPRRAAAPAEPNGTSSLGRTGAAPALGRTGAVAALGRTGAVPALARTGAVPRIGATGMVPRIDDPAIGVASAADSALAIAALPAPVEATHRRGLMILIGAAALLIGGVAAVLLLIDDTDDAMLGGLGRAGTIDTTRPDDPLRNPAPPRVGSAAPANPFFPPKSTGAAPRPRPTQVTTTPKPPVVETPTGGALRSEEIEEMAARYSTSTQRCYMRSQKGADAILVGDVKKIFVTLDIAPDGAVKNVTLSDHATNTLGKCLITSIRSWRFRASPGGLYKFSLQFVGS